MISNHEKIKLGTVINQVRGISYRENDLAKEQSENYIPVLRANNINEGKLDLKDLVFVNKARIKDLQMIKGGDIIIAASSGSLSVVGKAAQAQSDMGMSFGAFCKLIRPSDRVDAKYIGYYFQSPKYRRTISSLANGANINNIKNEHIDELIISLPPLETQKKIVKALDKAQALIDARKEQIRLMDELVKSRFFEMFGDPILNTMNWEIKTLGEFAVLLTSGSRGWSEYFCNEGKMFLTIKNVKNSKINTSNIQFVNPPETQEAVRTKVKEKDLLISITADLGRTGVIPKEVADFGAYINQHLSLVRVDLSKINPLYISYYLETDGGCKQFERKNQSAVKAGLNFNAIRSLNLLVPPLELQNEFEKYVQQMEKSKSEIQTSLNELITTQQALMQQYFG